MSKLLQNIKIEEIIPILKKQDPDKISLKKLYNKSIENSTLDITSFLTIRDLTELSGYNDWQIHIILILMFRTINNGSLCINLDNLERHLDLIDPSPSIYASHVELASQLKKWIMSNPESIISKNDYTPLILTNDKDSHKIYFHLYYFNEKRLLTSILKLIDQKNNELTSNELRKITSAIKHVIQDKPSIINGSSVILNNEQKIAVAISLLQNFTIISGGPGTGKTSITASIVRALIKLGYNPDLVAICAPTGRAAQRLTSSINHYTENISEKNNIKNIKSSTIHRLLGYNPTFNTFIYNSNNLLPHQAILIDEVSMIDLVLMANLLDAINPEKTKLVFIGDKNQLPSVEAGAVLADLLPVSEELSYSDAMVGILNKMLPDVKIKAGKSESKLIDRSIILKQSYRSEKNILRFAASINAQKPVKLNGEIPLWFEKNKDCEILPVLNLMESSEINDIAWPDPSFKNKKLLYNSGCIRIIPDKNIFGEYKKFRKIILSWATHQYLKEESKDSLNYSMILKKIKNKNYLDLTHDKKYLDELFSRLDQSRILTLFNNGNYGITGINSTITSMIREKFDINSQGKFYHGLPIMITQNNYKNELFNGDMGIVLKVTNENKHNSYRVFFKKGNNYTSHPLDFLPESKPAFAITVHKSQGSEFDQVLLILSNDSDSALLTRQILYTGITRAKSLCVLYGSNEVINSAINNNTIRETGLIL